jgi:hypothetical protein
MPCNTETMNGSKKTYKADSIIQHTRTYRGKTENNRKQDENKNQ